MKNLPVNWHEGLFLHPHHFQATDRYWHEFISTSEKWDHPYNYGIVDLQSSFEGTLFRVDKVLARLRDGTLVAREANSPPLTVDLEQALQTESSVRVYLCVPQLRPREANVDHGTVADHSRYTATLRHLYDETLAGGNEREVEVRELNVSLRLASDDRSGFEQLPIAQVKRSTGENAQPQMDDTFIPPTVNSNGWLPLSHGIVRGVHDLLIQNINELTEMLRDVDLRDHILEVTQSGRFALLDRLNEVSSSLGVTIPARGVHPLTHYLALCHIVGKLAIFTSEKRAPNLPPYDHDNLGPVFREVASLIRIIIESIQFRDYLQKSFTWEGDIMCVDLTPAWFDPRVDWYVGVDRPENVSDVQCRELLDRQRNNFLWKFGSNDRDIYRLADHGLKLQGVEQGQQARVLPPHQYWSYWRVNKDDMDRVFRAVSRSQKMAAFMKDQNNPAFEPTQFAGTSRFPVMGRDSSVVEFKLTLFGVSN